MNNLQSHAKSIWAWSLLVTIAFSHDASHACVMNMARGQTVLFASGPVRSGKPTPPSEYQLRNGDLLSIFAPANSAVRIFDPSGEASEVLVKLTPDQFNALSAQGGGRIPVHVQSLKLPLHEWLHFGAAKVGVVYITDHSRKFASVFRISVGPQTVAKRGETLVWNERRQDDPVHMTNFDALEIDLPGRPGDQWQISTDAGQATIQSITRVDNETNAEMPRVRIRLGVEKLNTRQVIMVQHANATYRFTLVPSGVPAC